MKKCNRCCIEKSISEFPLRSDQPGKPKAYCFPCQKQYDKENHLKRSDDRKNTKLRKAYGIGLQDKLNLLKLQKGKCAICKNPLDTTKNMHVDHCHETKKIRGLLCTKCNPGLGFFQDSIKLLQSAIKYLKKHNTPVI